MIIYEHEADKKIFELVHKNKLYTPNDLYKIVIERYESGYRPRHKKQRFRKKTWENTTKWFRFQNLTMQSVFDLTMTKVLLFSDPKGVLDNLYHIVKCPLKLSEDIEYKELKKTYDRKNPCCSDHYRIYMYEEALKLIVKKFRKELVDERNARK